MADKTLPSMPNEFRFQISTKPNARLLDVRGELATRLASQVGVHDWTITENLVSVYDADKARVFVVGFKAIGLSVTNSTLERFSQQLQSLFNVLAGMDAMQQSLAPISFNVHTTFFPPVNDSYESLVERGRRNLGDVRKATLECFGAGLEVIDVGVLIHLRARRGILKYQAGPERSEVVAAKYLRRHNKEGFADVGFLCDFDFTRTEFNDNEFRDWDNWRTEIMDVLDYISSIQDKVFAQFMQ